MHVRGIARAGDVFALLWGFEVISLGIAMLIIVPLFGLIWLQECRAECIFDTTSPAFVSTGVGTYSGFSQWGEKGKLFTYNFMQAMRVA